MSLDHSCTARQQARAWVLANWDELRRVAAWWLARRARTDRRCSQVLDEHGGPFEAASLAVSRLWEFPPTGALAAGLRLSTIASRSASWWYAGVCRGRRSEAVTRPLDLVDSRHAVAAAVPDGSELSDQLELVWQAAADGLVPGDQQVLRMLAAGRSQAEISQELQVSRQRVQQRVDRAIRYLRRVFRVRDPDEADA